MTLSANVVAAYMLVVFFTLQLGDIIVARAFMPAVGLLLGLAFIFFRSKKILSKAVSNAVNCSALFFLLLCLCLFLGSGDVSDTFFSLTKVFVAIFSFISAVVIFSDLKRFDLELVVYRFLILSSVFLLFEAGIRFSDMSQEVFSLNFYIYKVNSPFFFDSNTTGVFACICFVVSLYFKGNLYRERSRLFSLPLIFSAFAVLSLSRASIITVCIVLLVYFFRRFSLLWQILIVFLLTITFLFGFESVITGLWLDGSGWSKMESFARIPEIAGKLSFNSMLFGNGVDAGSYTYSYLEGSYAHSLIPMLLGQVGLLGMLLYAVFFLYIMFLTKGKTLLFMVILIVQGFSYLHPFYEFLFFGLGMIAGSVICLEQERKFCLTLER